MNNSKFTCLVIIFLFTISFAQAQNNDTNQRLEAAHLMPRQIFVGDTAVLIVPLPAVSSNIPDIVITPGQDNMPFCPNIDFHRIVLEQRVTGSRLLIEFTPFAAGTLELPVIEIGDENFAELTITVNSVIDEKASPHLSGPASALIMPGTALLLYGSLTAIIVFLLLVFLFLVKGKTILKIIMEKWRLFRLFKSIRKMEKFLHEEILRGSDKRIIVDKLSEEFRSFLSYLSGINCRVMTSSEFKSFPVLITIPDNTQETENSAKLQRFAAAEPPFLSGFFRSCDTMRFSGDDISSKDLLGLLEDVKTFVDLLENQKKNEQKEKQN